MVPILQSARLWMREMSLADLDFVSEMLGDPEVTRFYPKCYSRDEAKAWIARQVQRYAQDGCGLWLVVEKGTQRPVGQIGLAVQSVDGSEELELGYLIHRPYWRQGLATEGALACRDYAFRVLNRARVISLIRPENIPSQGVADKLGMRPERRTVFRDLEHIVYAATRASRV